MFLITKFDKNPKDNSPKKMRRESGYGRYDVVIFPADYSVTTDNGISVTRDSYTQITVSETPTADAAITLAAPTATAGIRSGRNFCIGAVVFQYCKKYILGLK